MKDFNCGNFKIAQGTKTILCGIVNVTPDSFSDGGKWNTTEKAVFHALELIKMGAGMLDIGGESTRPGSTFVPVNDEIARIVPVIRELKKHTKVPISIDTWKSEVAKAAIDAGADIINDITGFAGDNNMPKVVSKSNCGVILMFNPVVYRPEHPSCKIFPSFNLNNSNEVFLSGDEKSKMQELTIIDAMQYYLQKSIKLANEAGISNNRIMLDPGIGFGLTKKENLTLIKNIDSLHDMDFPVFLGVSRKRFVVNILNEADLNTDETTETGFQNRDFASSILTALAVTKKIEVVRVHSITEHKIACEIAYSICNAEKTADTNFQAYKKVKEKN